MTESYHQWQITGQETMNMGSNIRNGILGALGIAVVAFVGNLAWMHGTSSAAATVSAQPQVSPVTTEATLSGAKKILTQTGNKFVLEVRGMGVVVGEDTDEEIWHGMEGKADNHATYVSQNPEDYPNSPGQRLSDLGAATGLALKRAGRNAVDQWPLPVIIWYPPKAKDGTRPAANLAGLRQMASLGVTLLLWQEDANTDDGAAMIEKLFAFFDTHPDAPAALIFSTDGSMLRTLIETPGHIDTPKIGHVIPAMPDSVAAFLVTRSDRVDNLVRPYAVKQTANINKNDTEYDIVKLWNFFWRNSHDQGPDSFNAYFIKKEKEAGVANPSAIGVMSAKWWQEKLRCI